MNGKKVLNRLISLFLVINIVLFIINIASKGNQYVLSQERVNNITQLLARDKISMHTEILRDFTPKYAASLVFMGDSVAARDQIEKSFFGKQLSEVKRSSAASTKRLHGQILYYTLGDETLGFEQNELTYTNKAVNRESGRPTLEKAKSMCARLIERIDYKKQHTKYYIKEEMSEDCWKLTYYPMIEGIPVMDSFMIFEVTENGIAHATMYLADIDIKSKSKQNIYAADLVLFSIKDYMLDNGYTSIEEMAMCYKQIESEESVLGQQIIPTYKIKIGGLEKEIYVNAYTNEILNSDT